MTSCFNVLVTVITVRQCSKQWDVTTTSVLVEKLVPKEKEYKNDEMWEC